MPIMVFKNGLLGSSGSAGQYTGEKIPGDLDGWNVLSSDANKKFYNSYGLMTERSASLYHTYALVKSAVDKQTQYAIGSGLAFRSQPDWNLIPNFDMASAKDWGKDAQQILNWYFTKFNFYDKQSAMFSGAMTLGDSLLFFIREKGELADVIEFAGDQINWQHTRAMQGNVGYTLGIKHDQYLRRVGIIKKDGTEIDFHDKNGNANLVQFYIKEQPRQLRGNPLAYAIINLAKNDDRHHDAIVARAVIESIMVGSFETDVTNPVMQTENMAKRNKLKATGGTEETGVLNKIANAFKLGSGNFYQFRKGEKMNFNDLKTPSNNYDPFKQWNLNYIGAATGTPAQVIISRYDTSYTSHKGAFNDFYKSYMQKRNLFARNVVQVAVNEFLKDAILKGYISAPGYFGNPMIQYAYSRGSFLGPIPGAINPVQESTANKMNAESGFVKRGDVAAQYGNDWSNHLEEWAEQERDWFSRSPEKQAEAIIKQEVEE
ncbi:MAG: phage portal protein [Spirochaetia bacterium]|nr:phage portal protein [Spirochaetia bacterium]